MCYSVVPPGMLGKKETCSREATSSCSCQQQPTLSWIENTTKLGRRQPRQGLGWWWGGRARLEIYHFALATVPEASHHPRFPERCLRGGGQAGCWTAYTSADTEGRAVGTWDGSTSCCPRQQPPGSARCHLPATAPPLQRSPPAAGSRAEESDREDTTTRNAGFSGVSGQPGTAPPRPDRTAGRRTAARPRPRPPRPHSSVLGPGTPFRARPALPLGAEPLPK